MFALRRVGRFLDPGWNRFVAAFLYYVVLTSLVLGGADFDAPAMAVAYLAPPALYLGLLLQRAGRQFQRVVPALVAPGSNPRAA